MRARLVWKVYGPAGLVATCRYAEDAVWLMAVTPNAKVKYLKRVVWNVKKDGDPLDDAASIMHARADAIFEEMMRRRHSSG